MNRLPKIGDRFQRIYDGTICEIAYIGKTHIEFKYIICGPEVKLIAKEGDTNFLEKHDFFDTYEAILGIAYPDE